MKSHLSIGFINLNVSSKFPPKGEYLFIFSLGHFKNGEREKFVSFFFFNVSNIACQSFREYMVICSPVSSLKTASSKERHIGIMRRTG